MQQPDIPSLAIVATPIGNLKDLSFRAQEVLQSVDYVLCEDTRRGRKLKTHLGFEASLVSFHEHNERSRIPKVIAFMKNGKKFALISDAGSPVLSDPGLLLVQRMNEEGLRLTFIPGPSAVIAALVLSGLPSQPFTFLGFPPVQESQRKNFMESLSQMKHHTVVLFESPDRILGLLRELGEHLGDRDCAICRELTKMHEEVLHGKISELLAIFSARKLLGEFTVVVGPGQGIESIRMTDGMVRERFHQLEKEGYSRKDALKKVVKESGRSRNDLYRLLMKDHES
jgi:16S rRNA (cytidine1402-2'-O)-methyltransferase